MEEAEDRIINFSNKMITSDKLIKDIYDSIDSDNDDEPLELISLSSIINQITKLGDTFSKLDISHNRLLHDGLDILVDRLQHHKKLKFLSIAYNAASYEGIFNFLIKILNFTSVPYVDIRGNYGSNLSCIKKVLDTLDEDKKSVLKERIIWYGTEPFLWK